MSSFSPPPTHLPAPTPASPSALLESAHFGLLYCVKNLSGISDKVLRAGDGLSHPTHGSSCSCHYEGKLPLTDKIFDSSYKRGAPTTFAPNQVIRGAWSGTPIRNTSFCCHPLTGVPIFAPRTTQCVRAKPLPQSLPQPLPPTISPNHFSNPDPNLSCNPVARLDGEL